MSAEPLPTSDVIGLTKVAPFSRRGFMTASAAVTVRIWTVPLITRRCSARAAGARMGLVVDGEQGGGVDLGVALRGRQ